MLVSMKEILDHANKNNYAVIAPNACYEMELRAYIEVAEEMNAPLIIDVATFMRPDFVFVREYFNTLCEQSSVPIAINLDHGASVAETLGAFKAGFTGVMADRSKLPFEENVKQVREIVELAHSLGISVEAELGHVGQGEEYDPNDKSLFTKPEEAKEFVQRTDVDSLAVAIGTAHGMYKGTPKLDFELLEKIKKEVGIPLVIHGGSGTGDKSLERACHSGINKVNIFSDLASSAYKEIFAADIENEPSYEIYTHLIVGIKKRLRELIEISGSKNQNWSNRDRGISNKKVIFDVKPVERG